ncbi:MAG TPA: rRNA maturation RNase YbeY [bacterium]|nr:rRNA maturation RNase YbeY [bacterium]
MKMFLSIQHKNGFSINRAELRNAVKKTLVHNGMKISDPYEISIVFTGRSEIKEMNREYRNIDRATDVISFAFSEGEGSQFVPFLLGDIFICPEVVADHAEKFGTTFENELIFVVVHGVLHLLGFDHNRKSDREKMREAEDIVMKELVGNWNGRCEK